MPEKRLHFGAFGPSILVSFLYSFQIDSANGRGRKGECRFRKVNKESVRMSTDTVCCENYIKMIEVPLLPGEEWSPSIDWL